MAEVIATFAALSSFLQVVDFATKVTNHAYNLLKDKELRADDVNDAARMAWGYESIWDGVPVDPHVRLVPGALAIDTNTRKLKDECEAETKRLVESLNSLQINSGYVTTTSRGTTEKHPRKLYSAVRTAIKSPGIRKTIDQRRRHLQELNGLLSTALLRKLLGLHQQEISATYDAMTKLDEKMREEFKNNSDAEKLRRLAKEQSQGLRKIHQHILESLRYKSMDTRWENITDPYPRTYYWAVKSHSGLRSWLRHENGIFWISGKAGSGKSTLMKFIADSAVTKNLLREWCGASRLNVATYYFWYAGSRLQKSVQGLLQSVLLSILKEFPDLCQVAFPGHYTTIIPPDTSDLPSVSFGSLVKAFDAIADDASKGAQQRQTKFCLFIDGLDEYHGGNPLELIQLLKKLSNNPCIKLCVSSRPHNAFRAAFETSTPNLRLEDLSSEDIRLFVEGSLKQYGTPDDIEFPELVEEITVRAEGVFLWVFLVVKSILLGFAEEEPIWMLRRRVQEFPSDLEKFFDSILDRVDAVYKEHTNQALKLAFMTIRSTEQGLEASWVDFYFMRQSSHGLVDASFITTLRTQSPGLKQWRAMRNTTRSFLSASCKDLLWLPNPDSTATEGRVEFLHRTVYDYLNSESMQQSMDRQVPEIFLSKRIVHLLRLARQTLLHPDESNMRLEALRQLHAKSILRAHADRTETYMRTFESVLVAHVPEDYYRDSTLRVRNEDYSELMPEALPSLVAFGLHEYLAVFRDIAVRKSLGYAEAARTLDPGSLFRAALGQGDMQQFPLWEVNIETLSILLDFREVHKIRPFVEGEYSRYINLWAASEPLADRAHLRHLWEIAKLFLRKARFTKDFALVIPSSSTTTDSSFYRTRLPLDWLREAEQPRLLPDCTQRLVEYSLDAYDGTTSVKDFGGPQRLTIRSRSLDAIVGRSLFGSPSQVVQSEHIPQATQEPSIGFGFTPNLDGDVAPKD